MPKSIEDVTKDYIEELRDELRYLSSSRNPYYINKFYNLLNILEKKGLLSDVYRNRNGDIGSYSFRMKNISIAQLKELNQALEQDTEGVNKKLSGFRFFNSATVNRLTSITNKYIKQLKAFEPKPWWKCW